MAAFDALVEYAHGLVGASNLDLLKEGLGVIALGASGRGLVNVVPRIGSSQHVVDLLTRLLEPLLAGLREAVLVRAGGTYEPGGLNAKDVGAERAEPHGELEARVGEIESGKAGLAGSAAGLL